MWGPPIYPLKVYYASLSNFMSRISEIQYWLPSPDQIHEDTRGNRYLTDLLHARLAFFLFLQQFFLTAHVTAIEFGGHILA